MGQFWSTNTRVVPESFITTRPTLRPTFTTLVLLSLFCSMFYVVSLFIFVKKKNQSQQLSLLLFNYTTETPEISTYRISRKGEKKKARSLRRDPIKFSP